jgi:hypothetical protein
VPNIDVILDISFPTDIVGRRNSVNLVNLFRKFLNIFFCESHVNFLFVSFKI